MIEHFKHIFRTEFRLAAFLVTFFMLTSCHLPVVVSSYSHYRLPVSLQPDRYQLRIITHLDNPENLTFEGQVSIRFQALEDTNNITLHANNLTIDETRIQLKSYEDDQFHLCLDGVETVPEHDYYIIRLCQTLLKGQMYKIKLEFSGILNKAWRGYYRNSYVDEATNETRWLAVTHFEPVDARSAFPCFDEPNYKARFVIWLGHQKSLTALSNMPREKQIPMDDLEDYVWSIFEESVPMSTYLVAYTVNDFAYKESRVEGNDVVFRTWCRPDYIEQCEYAAEVAPKILQYYEGVFAIPFPLKKLDQIAVPNMDGSAMENWGLIIYKEQYFLHNPNAPSQLKKKYTTSVIAHELAHQWFGNLVTMKWWTDLWLNEGFATYVANLGVQHLTPELELNITEAITNSISILRQDDKVHSHPVSQPILETKKISAHFDEISYAKGSDILRMMHSFLGQDAFFEGVRDYLTKHKYKNAEQDDLWAAFTEIAHKNNRIQPQHDIKTIMDSWTLQTGYPLVNVSRNYVTGSMEISQRRYLENSTLLAEETNSCWWVPLSYTTSTELDFVTTTAKAWLECDESGKSVNLKLDNVTGADEWIMFNIQLTGIYRVMYDTDNWRLINRTLNSDSFMEINVMNRAQIIEDVLSFAWSGYVDYEVVFDIVEYLIREREYLPWNAAALRLSVIFSILEHFPEDLPYFKAYMRNIIKPIYSNMDELREKNEASTNPLQISFEKLVVNAACYAELEDCLHFANGYFQQWKSSNNSNDKNDIPVDLRRIVYCTAIRQGDTDDWAFLWQRYKLSKLDTEKSDIIFSLGCSHNATVLEDFIDLIFSKDKLLLESDVYSAFLAISRSSIGFSLALKYYEDRVVELHDNGFDVVTLAVILFAPIVSHEHLKKLTNIIESNEEYFKQLEDIFSQIIEMINFKLQRIENNLEDLVLQLHSRSYLEGSSENNVVVEK